MMQPYQEKICIRNYTACSKIIANSQIQTAFFRNVLFHISILVMYFTNCNCNIWVEYVWHYIIKLWTKLIYLTMPFQDILISISPLFFLLASKLSYWLNGHTWRGIVVHTKRSIQQNGKFYKVHMFELRTLSCKHRVHEQLQTYNNFMWS